MELVVGCWSLILAAVLVGAEGSAPSAGAAAGRIRTDPARLERLRSATMPTIAQPVFFGTPEADAICSALEVFPPDNPWNQLVDDWPLHPDSAALVASIGTDKPLRCNLDMGFVLVPSGQPRVPVHIAAYPAESDPGPYPVPANTPIEGWSAATTPAALAALAELQRRPPKYEADRHALIVDPVNRLLYEFFVFGKTDRGWEADQASVFDLKSNTLRPAGWTSADAAGLPIFPAVVRYDEIQRGCIDHALRATVRHTRRAFVAPATHYASRHDNLEYPRMGERLRLRADVDLSGFSPVAQTILRALQRYGMFVADNGIEWAISVAPDPRLPPLHAELRRVTGAAFEVVTPPQ
jgi:hypothetical protein